MSFSEEKSFGNEMKKKKVFLSRRKNSRPLDAKLFIRLERQSFAVSRNLFFQSFYIFRIVLLKRVFF